MKERKGAFNNHAEAVASSLSSCLLLLPHTKAAAKLVYSASAESVLLTDVFRSAGTLVQ